MTSRLLLDADCELELTPARLPLPHELLWTLEWAALRVSPVYTGTSVPRGYGEPVIVVPGFLGSVAGLAALTGWLDRIGYDVHGPGFERNIECPDVLLQRLEREIASVAAAADRPVRLIGHSLGGSLARAAAIRSPALVEQVITLGSPLHSVTAHPAVLEVARLLARIAPTRHDGHAEHSHGPTCACELSEALTAAFPSAVRSVAIYTRGDGVVDWRTCMDDAALNIEVSGTHLGLVVNKDAYAAIARALSGSPDGEETALAGKHGGTL